MSSNYFPLYRFLKVYRIFATINSVHGTYLKTLYFHVVTVFTSVENTVDLICFKEICRTFSSANGNLEKKVENNNRLKHEVNYNLRRITSISIKQINKNRLSTMTTEEGVMKFE